MGALTSRPTEEPQRPLKASQVQSPQSSQSQVQASQVQAPQVKSPQSSQLQVSPASIQTGGIRRKSKRVHWKHKRKRRGKSIRSIRR